MLQPACLFGFYQRLTDGPAHYKIAGRHRIGMDKRQKHLAVFVQRSAINTRVSALPVVTLAANLQVVPNLPALVIAAPVARVAPTPGIL